MEADRISNLPGDFINHIFSKLSIREVVRTSVLSSNWRYKWATFPHLAFDNQCFSVSSQDHTIVKNKLVNIVDHVLLLHNGPIYKFKLSHPDFLGIPSIDRWILYLSRRSIKEFVLEIWKGQRYKMPSSLFSCLDLIHLKLLNCLLKPPLAFKGFKSLKSLDLQRVTMAQDVFGNLISSCPLLERLTLMNFDGFTHLNIDAPKLQFFDIGGVFEDISFENTSCLTVISIGLYENVSSDKRRAHSNSTNLLKFFVHLPNIRRLEVQSYFLKYLAVGIVPEKLPTPCVHLNYLSIRINFNDVEEVLTALCLLRSSPTLKELEVLARPEEQAAAVTFTDCWKDVRCSSSFDQLRRVKIGGILGIKPELNFINFLLLATPVLETMSVKPASTHGGWELIKELLHFRRSSKQAEVIYLDP